MKKEDGQKEVSVRELTCYKREYVVDASNNTSGKGFAVIIEGDIVMNFIVWNRGTHISPTDKAKVSIEWLRDLIKVLEEGECKKKQRKTGSQSLSTGRF